MALDSSIYDRVNTQLPEQLASILNPINIDERRNKLADLANERKLNSLKVNQAVNHQELAIRFTEAYKSGDKNAALGFAKQGAMAGDAHAAEIAKSLEQEINQSNLQQATTQLSQIGQPPQVGQTGYTSDGQGTYQGMVNSMGEQPQNLPPLASLGITNSANPEQDRQNKIMQIAGMPGGAAITKDLGASNADKDMQGYFYDKQNNGFTGSFQSWLSGKAATKPEKTGTHIVTGNDGRTIVIDDNGNIKRDLGLVGKATAAFEKAGNTKKKLGNDLDMAISELTKATADNGLIDKSTGSGAGSLVDIAAGFVGHGTEGAIAVGDMKPIYDLVLKMVPRFEGPQSDKDTASYEKAAGQLANPAVPNSIKKAAGKEILRLMKARKNQFFDKTVPETDTSSNTGIDVTNPLLN